MRITGGEHRSRILRAPRGDATRPTSDRVREALFSILGGMGVLEGATVLDLYAGTGALALEALSRGAARATVVESGRDALAAIRANVGALGMKDRVVVVAQPVERAARAIAAAFPVADASPGPLYDLILADPPYADVSSGAAVRAVDSVITTALQPEGWLVFEHAVADPPPELTRCVLDECRRYGDTALSFFRALADSSREELLDEG